MVSINDVQQAPSRIANIYGKDSRLSQVGSFRVDNKGANSEDSAKAERLGSCQKIGDASLGRE